MKKMNNLIYFHLQYSRLFKVLFLTSVSCLIGMFQFSLRLLLITCLCRFSKRLHLLINKTNNTKRWSILDQVYTLLIYVTYQDDEYFLVANIRLFCSKNMLSFNHLFVFLYCVLKILKNRERVYYYGHLVYAIYLYAFLLLYK